MGDEAKVVDVEKNGDEGHDVSVGRLRWGCSCWMEFVVGEAVKDTVHE